MNKRYKSFILILATLFVLSIHSRIRAEETVGELERSLESLKREKGVAAAITLGEEKLITSLSQDQEINLRTTLSKLYDACHRRDKVIKVLSLIPEKFPRHKRAPSALFAVGLTWEEIGNNANARDCLIKLLGRYPQTREAGYARLQLKELSKKFHTRYLTRRARWYDLGAGLLVGDSTHVFSFIVFRYVFSLLVITLLYGLVIGIRYMMYPGNRSPIFSTDLKTIGLSAVFFFLTAAVGYSSHLIPCCDNATIVRNNYIDLFVSPNWRYNLVDIISCLVASCVMLSLTAPHGERLKLLFFKEKKHLRHVSLIFIAPFCILCLITILHFLFDRVSITPITINQKPWSGMGVVASLLFTPWTTELFFRGVFLATISPLIGFWPAALVSSAGFAITYFPLSVYSIVSLYVFSLVMSVLYERYGLFYCVTSHSLFLALQQIAKTT